jgi:polyisoprenoid-binding protein YceI
MRRWNSRALIAALALAGGACAEQAPEEARPAAAAATAGPVTTDAPAGEYSLDKGHASLIFRVSHIGLSNYTARFTRWDARLQLDPSNPSAASVTATIDPRSLETDYPDPALDFDAQLQGADWLNAAGFPQMTFRSTKVELTGPDTARISGDLSLRGVTRPVTLNARFNGGYAREALDPSGSRIGFSAQGTLKRSDFGISMGIPQPGSRMGVGDAVEFLIEAEFTRPAAATPAAG